MEKMTILRLEMDGCFAIRKRPGKGLLAGLWELPHLPGHASPEDIKAWCLSQGFRPQSMRPLPPARHIFSHVEWHMRGYEIIMTPGDEKCPESGLVYAEAGEIEREYPIPSAFAAYAKYLNIHLGKKGPSNK